MTRNPRIWFGALVTLLVVVAALFAPLLAPHDPLDQDLLNVTSPPFWAEGGSTEFLLGTDSLGRDVLSRLIYAARVALEVAILATAAAAVIGTVLGLLAGYFGGIFDTAVSRLVDIWMAFPPVLLAVVLVAVLGTGLTSVVIAIAIVDWTRFCRVVRAEVLVQREQDYVAAGVTIGMSRLSILWREIVPNVVPLLIVLVSLEMGIAVIVEAILSFVGLSIGSDAPTWGGMIQEGRTYINQAWWLLALPVACVILVVLGFNALGDGLRRDLDPVMRR
jgi:ABC-type dipeptide/oligopeptide/nickel transport system permease subunit